MLKWMTNGLRILPLLLPVVLMVSTGLMAADSPVASGEEREQRLEKVRYRAETYGAFKAAQGLYYDGLWMQARKRFLQIQRDGADLGLFHEQRIESYLKLIELKVDRLCQAADRPCVRAR